MLHRGDYVFTAAVGIDTAANLNYVRGQIAQVDRGLGHLAVGLLMSEKTGLLGIPNRHGSLYPTFAETDAIAGSAFRANHESPTQRLDIIIHYNTDHTDQINGQLIRALVPMQDCISGVQINGLNFDQA